MALVKPRPPLGDRRGSRRLHGHPPASASCTQPPGQAPESQQQNCHPAKGSSGSRCIPPAPTTSLASVQPSCSRTHGLLPSLGPLHLPFPHLESGMPSPQLASLTHSHYSRNVALLPHPTMPESMPPSQPTPGPMPPTSVPLVLGCIFIR